MEKTRVLAYLVEPINDRENDSPMFVYTKLESVMKGCKTIRQLNIAHHWARSVFNARFPEYSEFLLRLHSVYDTYFDSVMEKMHREINEQVMEQ